MSTDTYSGARAGSPSGASASARPGTPIVFHRFALSGHSHRVEMFLSMLGLPVRPVDVDLKAGAQRSPAFLALNAFGQVPVIEDDGQVIADSNAILTYLALRYGAPHWLPRDPAAAAQVQRWLSAAAGPLAFGPARARVVALFGLDDDPADAIARAHTLFGTLDGHLATRTWLAGSAATIADLAMYSYTAHAPEGGVALHDYRSVRDWLARVEALPGFVTMPSSATRAS